jgi:hypothetical protein
VIENDWPCIAGVHFQPEGGAAAVWIARDRKSDVLHLWDCAVYRREPLVMIAEGLNRHGRWIPIAWESGSKELIDKLLDRGCNTLPEPTKETPVMADAISRDIAERMHTGRFKVDRRLAEWLDEYASFKCVDGKVPLASHPLMSATRYATADLDYARRQRGRGDKAMKNYPGIAMI